MRTQVFSRGSCSGLHTSKPVVAASRLVAPPLACRGTRRGALVVRNSAGLANRSGAGEGSYTGSGSNSYTGGSNSSFGSGSSSNSNDHPLGPLGMLSVPNVTMARGGGGDMGSGASLGATLQRSKLEFVMPTPVVQGPKLDDGGSGGDIGKHNHNGGGGGDDGGDDDDTNFGEDEDGDGEGDKQTDGMLRTEVIPEQYDQFSIGAVLAEWMRTVADLPLIIRRAVEMGLFSSAQLVRFCSMDVRPSVARSVSRSLPPTWAREFVGRLMADPAFIQKLTLEIALAGGMSLHHEHTIRGERFKKELDFAAVNALGMAAATGFAVWLLAPTRSYGLVHKFPWQQMLDGLPNCVFDASGPLRNYSRTARAGSLLAKAAELSAVGAATGTVTSILGNMLLAIRRRQDPSFEPSVAVPNIGRSSGGLAAYFALNANVRYQLVGGLDRYLSGHSNYLWTYLGLSAIARGTSQAVGELSRPWWQGLPAQPAAGVAPVRRAMTRTRKIVKRPRAAKAAAAAAAAPVAADGVDVSIQQQQAAAVAGSSGAAQQGDAAGVSGQQKVLSVSVEQPQLWDQAQPLSTSSPVEMTVGVSYPTPQAPGSGSAPSGSPAGMDVVLPAVVAVAAAEHMSSSAAHSHSAASSDPSSSQPGPRSYAVDVVDAQEAAPFAAYASGAPPEPSYSSAVSAQSMQQENSLTGSGRV